MDLKENVKYFHMGHHRNQWLVLMWRVLVYALMQECTNFTKNVEHTSKLKAPEGYVNQVAYCALKILDFPL